MITRFTVNSEVDFIALAPITLGFQPTNSLVMMTLDKFHARVDLPGVEEDVPHVVRIMLDPVRRHQVKRVAFVVFGDGSDYRVLKHALLDAFGKAGVRVLAALEVDGSRYRKFGDVVWRALDLSGNPITLEAQYAEIRPQFASREAMADSVKPCGEAWTDDTQAAVNALRELGKDAVVLRMTRQNAAEATELWSNVLRCTEPSSELACDVALVLAFAAWLAGNGGLAWVALDQADPSTRWHELLTLTLQQAISPDTWSTVT